MFATKQYLFEHLLKPERISVKMTCILSGFYTAGVADILPQFRVIPETGGVLFGPGI